MLTSTATIVDSKAIPIAKVEAVKPAIFTAQAAANLFAEFEAANTSAQGAVVAVMVSTLRQALPADAKEFALATSGMVEGTRSVVDTKRVDGPKTDLARKFQSMVRACYGAVRFAGWSIEAVESYTNSQRLYDDARKALEDGGVDWKGLLDEEKALASSQRAKAKAVKAVIEDEGVSDVLALTPEQFGALQSKANLKLQEAKAKAKLEAMQKRAEKIADDLVESFGSTDDAIAVLTAALAKLGVEIAAE